MMPFVTVAMQVAGTTAVIYAALALGLIASQRPVPSTRPLSPRGGLDFDAAPRSALPEKPGEQYVARDGCALPLRRFGPAQARSLVVLVHGSGWHGGGYVRMAEALARAGHHVLVPDLRGHGANPRTRGDIAHIDQLEEDLADLIDQHAQPGQTVTLLGHSSGGGLVIRFAGGPLGGRVDRAVLVAPFLQYDAPTVRRNAGGWAFPLTRRLIGLSMLNAVGLRALNHLTVIQFNFPDSVLDGPLGHTATQSYSYRLNTGFAPRRDYLSQIARLPPFLLLVGAEDEAFDASRFAPTMAAVTPRGTYRILPGLSHLDILHAPQAMAEIGRFLDD